jgi:hypothetical protein
LKNIWCKQIWTRMSRQGVLRQEEQEDYVLEV